jgi:hypothetical protein
MPISYRCVSQELNWVDVTCQCCSENFPGRWAGAVSSKLSPIVRAGQRRLTTAHLFRRYHHRSRFDIVEGSHKLPMCVSASCFMTCVDPRVNGSPCLPHSQRDLSVRYPSLRPTPLSLYPMGLRIPTSKRGRPHQATTNSPESPQP